MSITFDLRYYSESYSYAYVRISDDNRSHFDEWCAENRCTIEQEGEVDGWDFIVNINGKGGAALFKLSWAGQESELEKHKAAAKRDFFRALGITSKVW